MKLEDTSPMPFGQKYRGIPMQDVPVNYLHWFWENIRQTGHAPDVTDYIYRNLEALKQENKDLIWSRK